MELRKSAGQTRTKSNEAPGSMCLHPSFNQITLPTYSEYIFSGLLANLSVVRGSSPRGFPLEGAHRRVAGSEGWEEFPAPACQARGGRALLFDVGCGRRRVCPTPAPESSWT